MLDIPMTFRNMWIATRFIYHHGISGFKIFTHLTWQERIILYQSVRQLKAPRHLVEIGSYLGASAYFLAAAATEATDKISLHCIDTWHNEGMSEGYRDTWNEFSRNVARYEEIIVPRRGISAEICKSFVDEIDLLFIDGDHSFEGCKTDADCWIPRVRKGGTVLFHDYGWAEGVRKVVYELTSCSILANGTAYQNIYWAYKA